MGCSKNLKFFVNNLLILFAHCTIIVIYVSLTLVTAHRDYNIIMSISPVNNIEELLIQLSCHYAHIYFFYFTENKAPTGQTRKGKRMCFTSKARNIIKAWYTNNRDCPYPSGEELQQMAEEAKIKTSEVLVFLWMIHKRSRYHNTVTTNGAMDLYWQQLMLIKEAKGNAVAVARRAAARKSRFHFLHQEAVKALKRWSEEHKDHPMMKMKDNEQNKDIKQASDGEQNPDSEHKNPGDDQNLENK